MSSTDALNKALDHMEAALDLLDQSAAAPAGTAEYLDLAINNLAASIDPSGKAQLRQLVRVRRLGQL